ncbi:MAG TPA: DUF1906 domain-containing protein [Acidimicrobiia bacterium]|nr:DUF1906 domain-containing protein [Acidimicrobiia bacterium]
MRERVRHHRRFFSLAGLLLAGVLLAACVPPPPPPPPGTFTGAGFDTCAAPSTSTMAEWLYPRSPYKAMGIYIGGETRGCSQPNLNASWVSQVGGEGWHLAPLYVGLQDACSNPPGAFGSSVISFDTGVAFEQGVLDAANAANEASALQIAPGPQIYLDLESYNTGGSCTASAMSYVNGWVQGLHSRGYGAGVYSSAGTGMQDLIGFIGAPGWAVPDTIWFAHWNGAATLYGDPYIRDTLWSDHQRIHQYVGGHDEVWGGVDINIDNDAFDVPLVG